MNHSRIRLLGVAVLCASLLAWTDGRSLAQDLPILADDSVYAKKLLDKGFYELAIEVLRKLEAAPDATPQKKQEIGMLMVGAYRALAGRAADLPTREKYIQLANEKVELMAKQFGATPPAEFRYEQAVLLQTQGRSLTKAVKEENNPENKKKLVARAIQVFDQSLALFQGIATEGKAKLAELQKDPEKNAEAIKPVNEITVKAEMQITWIPYYKAMVYEPGQAECKAELAKAVELFGKYIDDHGGDMSLLNALYGKGLCEQLLDKNQDALKSFNEVVEKAEPVEIPEVQGLRAQSAIKWAEVSMTLGNFTDALQAMDKMLKENTAVQKDPRLAAQGMITKAKVLGAKGNALKAKDAEEAKKVYTEAIDLLQQVVQKYPDFAPDVSVQIGIISKASGLDIKLSPEVKLQMVYEVLAARKYDEGIKILREIVDDVKGGVLPATAFKAHTTMAKALSAKGDYANAIKEFDAILRIYGKTQPKDDLAAVEADRAWTIGRSADMRPDDAALQKLYTDSLQQMVDKYPDRPEGQTARYYLAQNLVKAAERTKKPEAYAAAAKAFAVVGTDSKFYGKSRYLEGLSFYNASKLYKAAGKKDEAQQNLKMAEDKLKAIIDNLLSTGSGEDWHMDAIALLAEIYNDLGQFDKANEVVDQVIKRFPEIAAKSARINQIRLNAYIKAGKLPDAVAVVDKLAASPDSEPLVLLQGYMKLADAYQKQGLQLMKEGKTPEADKAFGTTSDLLTKALPYAPKDDMRVLSWLVKTSYDVKSYDTCTGFIDLIEAAYKEAGKAPDQTLWGLRIMKAKCFKAKGKWTDDGLKLLDELVKAYPKSAAIKMLQASVLMGRGEWKPALDIWDEVDAGMKEGTPEWFDAKYNRALCYFNLGDKSRALDIIKIIETLNPAMGGPEMKQKFEELKKKCK
jgi:tetratricopeptide (TPR) repeat protein